MATRTMDLPEAPWPHAAYRLAADGPRCGAPLVLRHNRQTNVLFTGCGAYRVSGRNPPKRYIPGQQPEDMHCWRHHRYFLYPALVTHLTPLSRLSAPPSGHDTAASDAGLNR